ncbi:hypothetical protein BJX62DRAFT_183019 [Aspergillus germanicus]
MSVRNFKKLGDLVKNSVATRTDSTRTPHVTKSSPSEDKEACLRVIETLTRLLLAQQSAQIADNTSGALEDSTQKEFARFKIDVQPLGLNGGGTSKFFFPMSSQDIAKLSLGDIPDRTKKNLEVIRNVLDGRTPHSRHQKSSLQEHVQELAYYFGHTTDLPRIDPKNQVDTLAFFTGWKLLMGYSPKYDRPSLDRLQWRCTDGWTCRDTRFPHFKAVMWTAADATEHQPLRSEVVTILGIMAERHKAEKLRGHTIIPVMLVSFVGPNHGRILLAHFDGNKLYIEISALLPIATQDNTNMDTLIRWWAAKANPEASTTKSLQYGIEKFPPTTSTKN